MTTISGTSNWRLTVRRDAASVTILRAVTCDARAALPDELFGLRVTALADHALAPDAAPAAGEEMCITCGIPQGEWSNRGLCELTLPEGLARVENYALLNCRALHTLRLHDGVSNWGGGVLMNCRALRRIVLTRVGDAQGETLAYFADELSRELDVSILGADGGETRLIFPEYIETFEENSPAHHFDYTISGAGHPYHHVFTDKVLSLAAFDALWARFISVEHDDAAALRLAWYRLRCPTELGEGARGQYAAYLRARAAAALRFVLDEDETGLGQLLSLLGETEAETLSAALAYSRERRKTSATALLLEQRHRRSGGMEKNFDL